MPTDFPAESASTKRIAPEVKWAQRSSESDAEKNFIYLTISVPDVPTKDMKLDLKPSSLTFEGHSETKKATYHVEIELWGEIDPDQSKVNHSARDVEMKLQKKELKEEYWPRLLKDNIKVHNIKTDFDKWVDEDEQEGVPDDDTMNQFGGGMPGMPGMEGMGGMGGMGGEGGFGGLDFSKLGGGAGGLGDLGADAGDEEEGDEEDDEEMPELEDEDAKDENTAPGKEEAADAKGKGKIQEVE
ncbi:MAG: hypothetical protein M1831_003573 [Alyxoria varia]|nr:MAG: hypothetical protein M1831_003573 [Alyxoria varia]